MQDNGGERELVLGNKQLLTIFFVAALLCGVFFAVGYVVGGNSAKAGGAVAAADGAASATASDGKREEPQTPSVSDTATTTSTTPSDAGSSPSLPSAEPRMADNPAASGTQPASAPVGPAPVAPAPARYTPAQPAPAQTAVSAPTAATTAASGVFVSAPEKGASYWQVTAAKRPNADDLVRALREAGLPAILANSSKPDLFEVLVGPYHSAQTLAETKRKLIDLGYNGLIPHKE